MRVVSLLPSATEMVCIVGASQNLVGISHECDFPEFVRELPALTRARIAPFASSKAIDTAVREVIRDALSIYVSDGNALFNRAGPRLVESLEIMAACVHSALFADFAEEHAAVIRAIG